MGQRVNILIVGDDRDFADSNVALLSSHGYRAQAADTFARLREAGVADFFTRPIDPSALSEAVERALQDER